MRKLSGLIMLLLLSVVLVACGSEDEEPEPTVTPDIAVESEPTEVADIDLPATSVAGTAEAASTPVMEEASTPAAIATPVGSPEVDVVASPVATPAASPVATPMATPVASPVMSASPMATPDVGVHVGAMAPPVTTGTATMIEMTGTVVLNGNENEAFVMTGEGCIGLGQYANLRDGRQVVIRNEEGTIVSVAELGRATETNGCSWEFVAQVPESAFYSVSIPLTFEQVFPKAQVNESDGSVRVELP